MSSLALILSVFPRIASPRWFCILISRLSHYSLGIARGDAHCTFYTNLLSVYRIGAIADALFVACVKAFGRWSLASSLYHRSVSK